MTTSLTAPAAQVPGYCTSGHGVLTPQQWQTCASIGWHQPNNVPVGSDMAGHGISGLAVVAVLLIVGFFWLLGRTGRSRTPVPASK